MSTPSVLADLLRPFVAQADGAPANATPGGSPAKAANPAKSRASTGDPAENTAAKVSEKLRIEPCPTASTGAGFANFRNDSQAANRPESRAGAGASQNSQDSQRQPWRGHCDPKALLESFEERAAIREFDGGLSRADAESAALEDLRAPVRAAAEALMAQARQEFGLTALDERLLAISSDGNPYWSAWVLRELVAAARRKRH